MEACIISSIRCGFREPVPSKPTHAVPTQVQRPILRKPGMGEH